MLGYLDCEPCIRQEQPNVHCSCQKTPFNGSLTSMERGVNRVRGSDAIKKMPLCGSVPCLFSLNDFQIKLTKVGIHDACSGLQLEANKTSGMVTLLFLLLHLIPWDDCQIVQGRLGACESWALVSAHEHNSSVGCRTTVGLLASTLSKG